MAKLPKADNAIIAEHEAGKHDVYNGGYATKGPQPATCRECAKRAVAEKAAEAMIPVITLAEPVAPKAKRPSFTQGLTPTQVATTKARSVARQAPKVSRSMKAAAAGAVRIAQGSLAVVAAPVPPKAAVPQVVEQAPIVEQASVVEDPAVGIVITEGPLDIPPLTTLTFPVPPQGGFHSREEWMLAAVEAMRPWMVEVDAPVGPVRISFGWPGGRGSKKNVRGQCWMPEAVKDAIPAVFVSPAMESEDTVTILGIILHEMNHAAGHFGHLGAFAKTAAALGFVKPWTSSEGKTPDLLERLTALATQMGPLDHASINSGHGLKGSGPAAPPVQSTRMLKVFCPEDGYTLRATAKWLNIAVPSCPLCEALMTVEWK